MNQSGLAPEEQTALAQILHNANQELIDTGREAANRAFNFGCSMSLIPAGIVVILVYFLAKASWLAAIAALFLIGVIVLGLANLAAITAKKNATQRAFDEQVQPKIQLAIERYQLEPAYLLQLARSLLPAEALLHRYLAPADQATGSPEPISVQEEK